MDDDFVKKRLERDLADLKRMCDDHFKKREEDDSVVTDLEKRIADRQTVSIKMEIVSFKVPERGSYRMIHTYLINEAPFLWVR